MVRSAGSRLHRMTGSRLHCRTGSGLHRMTGSRLHCRTGSRLHCRTGGGLHCRTGSGLHCRTGSGLHCRTGSGLHCRTDCRSSGAGVTVSLTGACRRGCRQQSCSQHHGTAKCKSFFHFQIPLFFRSIELSVDKCSTQKSFFQVTLRKNSKVFPYSSLKSPSRPLFLKNRYIADLLLTFLYITTILYRQHSKPKENNNHGCFFKRVSGSFRDLGVYIH